MGALLGIHKEMLEDVKYTLEGFLANYEYQPPICIRLDQATESSHIIATRNILNHIVRELQPASMGDMRLVDRVFRGAPNVMKRADGTLRAYFIDDSGLPLLKDFYLCEVLSLDEAGRKEWLDGDDDIYDAYDLLVDRDGSLSEVGHKASDELKLELQTYSHRRAECIRHGITVVEGLIELLDCRLAAKEAA